MPSRSYAIVPLIAFGVSAVSTAGVTISAADVAGLAIALAGVAAIAYMNITAPDGSSIAIPLGEPVPLPYAPPTMEPIPGELRYTVQPWAYCSSGAISTADALVSCQEMAACDKAGRLAIGASWWWVIDGVDLPTSKCLGHDSGSGGSYPIGSFTSGTTLPHCSDGYTLVNGVCNLTSDPRLIVHDNREDFSRSGETFSPFAGDLVGVIEGIQGTTNAAGDTISFVGSNAGEPSSLSVVALPGGGYAITQSTQLQDASGITYVSNASVSFDSAGGLVSTSGSALSGSLDTNTASLSGGAVFVGAPAGSIPATPASSQPIVFPTDYARQGEIAAAVAPVTSALTSTSSVADPIEPLLTDMPGWGDTFSGLTGWGLPAHVSACPTPSMDLSRVLGAGSVYTMTAHCDLFAAHAVTFQAVMIVVWSILALFIVLGA